MPNYNLDDDPRIQSGLDILNGKNSNALPEDPRIQSGLDILNNYKSQAAPLPPPQPPASSQHGSLWNFGRGVLRGGGDFVDGLTYLGSLGLDKLAGTNFNKAVSDYNKAAEEEYQKNYGDSWASGGGRLAGNILPFMIPGGGAVSTAGKIGEGAEIASNAGKLGRVGELISGTIKAPATAVEKLGGGAFAQGAAEGAVSNAVLGTHTQDDSLTSNLIVGGLLGGLANKYLAGKGGGKGDGGGGGNTGGGASVPNNDVTNNIADNIDNALRKATAVDVDTPAARASALKRMMATNPDIVNKLSPGQITGNEFLQTTDSVLNFLPFTGKKEINNSLRDEINKSTAKHISVADDSFKTLSPANIKDIKDVIDARYKYFAQKGSIEGDNYLNMLNSLKDLKEQAGQTASNKASFDAIIGKIRNNINPSNANLPIPKMTGEEYQKAREAIKTLYKNKDVNDFDIKQGIKILDDAFKQSLPDEALQAFNSLDKDYRNYKGIAANVMQVKNDGGVGDNLYTTLPSKYFNKNSTTDDLVNFARNLNTFVKNPIADSGTTKRTMIADLLTKLKTNSGSALGVGGSIAGAGGLGYALGGPIGAAALAATVPKLATKILNSDAARKLAINSVLKRGGQAEVPIGGLLGAGIKGANITGGLLGHLLDNGKAGFVIPQIIRQLQGNNQLGSY